MNLYKLVGEGSFGVACIKKILKINTSQNHKFIQASTETCIKNAKYMVRHGAEIYTS